jgi:hypothetical protein
MPVRRRYIQKALAGAEDILFGEGTVSQSRNGETVTISKVNATNIPYSGEDATFQSIKDQIDLVTGFLVNVNQAAHGFVVGNVIYVSAADTYAKAKADALATVDAVGMVTVVDDADNFSYIAARIPVILTTAQWDAIAGTTGGLTGGSKYYLSAATAGLLTASAPTYLGKLVLIGINSTTGLFINNDAYSVSSEYGVVV